MAHEFSPAAAFLVESGRRSLGLPARAAGGDWNALPHAAQRHGMAAWLHAAMPSWPEAPDRVRNEIAEQSRAQRMHALHALSQLATAVAALEHAGIAVVSLKGPLFSVWLYGDVGMRRFADLDLLIDRADAESALDALRSIGYSLPDGLSPAAARAVYAGTGAWPLAHATGFGVDLHWRLQALGFGAPLQAADVIDQSARTSAAGTDMRIPAPTHAAALAFLHAAKHLWAALEIVLSLAHVMRRRDVDWSGVHHLAARAGAWNGSAAGLVLANELFDVDLPAPLRARIRPRVVRPLVDAALRFLSMPDVAGASRRAEMKAHLAGLDGIRGRLRYAAWRLFAPTPLEPAWCPLPDRLAALYAPIRLIRLASRRPGNGK